MEDNKKSNVILNFYKVFKYIERKNIKDIVIWGFLMLLVGILPAIPVALNKRLIDGLSAQSRSSVFTCVLICVFIGVLEIVVSILENICGVIYQKVNYQTTHKMERKLLRKKIVLAQDGLSTNGIEIMENLISIISNTISIVSVFVMLFMVSWKLPIAIVGSMVPTLVAVIVSKKCNTKCIRDWWKKEEEETILSHFFKVKEQ